MKIKVYLVVILLSCGFLACSSNKPPQTTPEQSVIPEHYIQDTLDYSGEFSGVGFCEIIKNPESFDKQMLEIEAYAVPGYHVGISLKHPDCPEQSFVIYSSDEIRGSEKYKDLWKETHKGFPPPPGRSEKVLAHIRGRFFWFPSTIPSMVFLVNEVLGVEVQS